MAFVSTGINVIIYISMENILLFISDGISRIKYVFLKDEISLELFMLNYQKKQILSRTNTATTFTSFKISLMDYVV